MIELTVLCEGPTEVGFVNNVQKPYFIERDFFIKSFPLNNKNFGVVPWNNLYRAQRASVGGERKNQFTTSLIDLYALPDDYKREVSPSETKRQLAKNIEQSMRDNMPSPQWIPHLQLHEFEAMIFVDLDVVAKQFPGEDLSIGLRDLRSEIRNTAPEEINDDPQYAPSKRILRHIPSYGKAAAGPAIVREIGIERLKASCPHFGQWIETLERLPERLKMSS